MNNAKGRLAEAYTTSASSCPGTPIVDEGFSYSVRGETTDIWEKTPNSGTYYHPAASYWANGALNTRWISSLPSITYNVDGKGRTSTVSASSGQNPVTLTSYNTPGQVTKVTFGFDVRVQLELGRFVRSRWFAPALHLLLFATTWLADLAQSQPLLDGPARFAFALLFIADFPISLVAFSAMWDGKLGYALLLWGVLGSAWWYLLGLWIQRRRASTPH